MDAKLRYKAKKVKIVFFDIDDTLRAKETGLIPESVKDVFHQLKEKGISSNIDDLVSDLKDRDRRDMERSVAPLKPAEGARILDSSGLTLQETIDLVLAWYRESKA